MAAAGGAAHGFRGVSQQKGGKWQAFKMIKVNGKYKTFNNGKAHGTPEEAAHAHDCMLYYLEADPDYNLPERMTADVLTALKQHNDVFGYLEAQKKLFAAKADANYRKGASKFRGVSLDKTRKSNQWQSRIRLPGMAAQLKANFATEEEAAHDYDRKAIRRDGRQAMLNFPLETYADEFSAAELDAIDARVAAGKPPPLTAAPTKSKGKAQSKAAAAPKPRQQRGGGKAGGSAPAAAAAGEASGSGTAEELPEYEDWEEEWAPVATVKDDPATWTREQREAYRIMHPYEDIFTPEELDELSEDVTRLSIKDDYEEFKRENGTEVQRKCEAEVARCAALLEEVRGTEDEPFVAADLTQAQEELAAWETQVPPGWLMWQMFEEEQMTRYYKSMRERTKKYPLTYEALYNEDRWFDPLTGQPNMLALQSAFVILERDLPQMMRILKDADDKDKYVVKLLRIRRFLDARDMEMEGRSAEELVQLRWALGRDEDVDEEDPEESFGVFDASDDEEEEPPPAAAFPADFSLATVEALLAGVVDATHGIFERAENGPAAAAGLPPNAPANPRFARPAPAAAGGGSGGLAAEPSGAPAAGSSAAAGSPPAAAACAPAAPAAAAASAQPAAAARAPAPAPAPDAPAAAASGPACAPAFTFGSGKAPPTAFGGFTGLADSGSRGGPSGASGSRAPAPFQFGSGAAPPATFGGFAGGGGSAAASASAFHFSFGSGATPSVAFRGFGGLSGASGGASGPASASALAFGGPSGLSGGASAAAVPLAFGTTAGRPLGESAGGSAGDANQPAPAPFAFPPYSLPAQPPATGAGGSGSVGSAGASGSRGPATPASGAAGSAAGASGSRAAGLDGASSRGSAGGSGIAGAGGSGTAGGSQPAVPSGWLNIESFGDAAATDLQARADWHYEMTLATPSGPGGQFSTEDYAHMLANLVRRERRRQAEGHTPGWNGAPDIRSEEEQEAETEAAEAAWRKEKAEIEARMEELQREGAKLVNHIKKYTYDVKEHMRERDYLMSMTYWEGQCLAHMQAGHHQWLEDLMGPSWRERVNQWGVTTPHLFGTHNWRESLPPIDPAVDIIFMEMTGFVANTPLGEGLAGELGWTSLPTLDDATLAIWFNVICEQARMGLPTIGLAPVESWAPGCTKWDWRREMRERGKKFTCSHPWLFLQRMRPIRLHGGFDYPPGTPDVVRPSVQRAMRQSCEERDAVQLRAAEEVAALVRNVAAAAETGVQAGRMHHGVASGDGATTSGSSSSGASGSDGSS